jgi:hypothetical protein
MKSSIFIDPDDLLTSGRTLRPWLKSVNKKHKKLVQFRHKERGRGAVCCHGSIGGKRELYSDRGRAEG